MTWMLAGMAASVRDRERKERDVPRALDGQLHLSLVPGAVTADAARNDLAPLGDEVLERLRVLVVDDQRAIGAVAADALLAAAPPTHVGVQIRAARDVLVVVHHGHVSALLFGLDLGRAAVKGLFAFELLALLGDARSLGRLRPEIDEAQLPLTRFFLLVLRGKIQLSELDLLGVDLKYGDIDLVGRLDSHELDDRVLELQVSLHLRHEPPAADVLDVHVDAPPLLSDGIRELAPAPGLDLHELAALALESVAHARLNPLGRFRIDVRAKDVNGFVLPDAARPRRARRGRRNACIQGLLLGSPSGEGAGPWDGAHERGGCF